MVLSTRDIALLATGAVIGASGLLWIILIATGGVLGLGIAYALRGTDAEKAIRKALGGRLRCFSVDHQEKAKRPPRARAGAGRRHLEVVR